jgi:hypothetical protein
VIFSRSCRDQPAGNVDAVTFPVATTGPGSGSELSWGRSRAGPGSGRVVGSRAGAVSSIGSGSSDVLPDSSRCGVTRSASFGGRCGSAGGSGSARGRMTAAR